MDLDKILLDEALSHADLWIMREKAPQAAQKKLAAAEHRAFAREWTQEDPVLASMSLPFAIPAYSAAKATGLQKARTPASLEEIAAGYKGWLEGLFGMESKEPEFKQNVEGSLPRNSAPAAPTKTTPNITGKRG